MNKQYQELKVEEGIYIPQPALDYPENNPFERTLFPTFDRELLIDENYPYLNDSPSNIRRMRWGYLFILKIGLNILLRVKMGLRIRGREILKKYKKEFSQGAITIANHVFRLDCPCVLLEEAHTHPHQKR